MDATLPSKNAASSPSDDAMDADGDQGAGDHREEILGICASAVLIKESDHQQSDERSGERCGGDLGGDDDRSSWAPVRIGQMTFASGTGGHSKASGNGATITQAHSCRESQPPSYQSLPFRV
jgi:hypothetical protein